MIYLASPYSHDDPDVKESRFQAVCKQTALMLKAGILVFSPIAHSHPVASYGMKGSYDVWQRFDESMIERCDEVWVLMLDGVEGSVGIKAEMEYARKLGRPVHTIMPGQTKHQVDVFFGEQS